MEKQQNGKYVDFSLYVFMILLNIQKWPMEMRRSITFVYVNEPIPLNRIQNYFNQIGQSEHFSGNWENRQKREKLGKKTLNVS